MIRLLLSDALDPLRHGSDLQGISSIGTGPGANRSSVINSADSKITCSISYADVKMSSLVELNSPAEYRTWLLTKVKYMAQQGKQINITKFFNNPLNKKKFRAYFFRNGGPFAKLV